NDYLSVINNTSSAGAISFGARIDFTTGTAPYRATIGDYDSDGLPDIAVANSQSNSISVFRNIHASGAFSSSSLATRIDFNTGSTPYFLCSGDLDNDNDYELVSADFNSSTLTVYKNLLNTCAPLPSCSITAALTATADTTGSLTYGFAGSSTGGTMTGQSLSINGSLVSSGQDTINYTFPAPGVYQVCYTVYDSTFSSTCSNQFCIDSLYVGPVSCAAVIQPVDNGSGSFTFTAVANTPGSWLTSYSWDFGDGSAFGGNPGTHQYNANGTYTVTINSYSLDPGDSLNYCSSTDTVSVNVQGVTAPGCSAGFVIWADTLNPSLYYGFNTSTGTNLYYLWDFGDGTTSAAQFPMHNYATPGFYQLCLTVTDSIACTDTYCDSAGVFRISSSAPGISQLTILPNPTAIQENSAGFSISLYPNPVEDNAVVMFTADKTMGLTIAIVNSIGQLVATEAINASKGENKFHLNTASLANGIYLLHITEGNNLIKNIRFVK
ncbi:MAG: PKD domain-containing protein, partial [Bacteroidia bacterium]